MTYKRMLLAMGAGAFLAGGSVYAQSTAPVRVRATIEKIDGNMLSLKARDGHEVKVMLTADAKIVGVTTTQVGAIKPGSFIGTAAIPQPDGTLKALEVTVFPPSMNGTGEGSYAWDLGANSTMTNGTVGSFDVANGRTMTVTYKGGQKKVMVPDDVPIVSLEPADRSLLKVGAHVIVVPSKDADGGMSANRISVGENGTVPPM